MAEVLIVGSGGREHALGWKIAQSPHVSKVIYAPGNPGTAMEKKRENIGVDGTKKANFPELFDFVKERGIDMVVVGPEGPLCDGVGIVNYFNAKGFSRIFGPSQNATSLEADKFYSYGLMKLCGIPQADSILCHSLEEGIAAIGKIGDSSDGVVLKARGLTGGKGVSVFDNKAQASASLEQFIKQYETDFLVAERLYGQEYSVFGFSDGERVVCLEIAVQDHKPLLENDCGPNTGGMGAYCPVPIAGRKVINYVSDKIMNPLVQKMKKMGNPYRGFLYAGMMLTETGPKVLEFNARMGDPETQPAMMMLKTDLYEVLDSTLQGRLDQVKLEHSPGAACCVVLASQGYPGEYKKGLIISGLDEASKLPGVKIFHAGTRMQDGNIVISGGRVLGVTGYSENGLSHSRERAYRAADMINIPGGFHLRRDIGVKGLAV